MALIFINRDRQNIGQFTEQEVADGLKSGKFLPTDLAWQEPMASWQPLSTFTSLPEPSIEPAAAPLLPEDSVIPSSRPEPAWERTESMGAMVESVKSVIAQPVSTFQAMPTEGGFAKPLKFYILLGWLTGAVAMIYQGAASLINPSMMLGEEAKYLSGPVLAGIFIGVVILMPLFLLIGAFVSAGLMHVAMMVVGGAKKPFETTFRALAYASASTSVAQVIPLCGATLYMVASIIYSVIALKEAHQTEIWRPIVAFVIVFLLCCGVGIGFVGLTAAVAGAAGSIK